MDQHQETTDKKEYLKPQLTEVRLVAAEAVLGDCKNGLIGGLSACEAQLENCGGDVGVS